MANEKLIELAMDHLDDGPISYCVERLLADTWDENSTAATAATTLKYHLRTATRGLSDTERAILFSDSKGGDA
jgi:hypothetical protein